MQIGITFAQSYVSNLQIQPPLKLKVFIFIAFVFWTINFAIAQIGWIPKWSFIADSGSSICSPLVVNGIAIVGSGWENAATGYAAFAVDISTGSLRWKKKFTNQIIGISAPHKNQVIITGRKGIFSCVDIYSGNEIWKYNRSNFNHTDDSLRYNFNQPQWVEDLNNDGEKDLIAVYGGGSTSSIPFRPPGYLMAIDGANGNIIAADTMPDGTESYATPLIYNENIYFGSGGETVAGNFYKVSFDSLLSGNIQNAKVIASDSVKGFISAPTIFGETMLIPCLNEKIYAYDLANDSILFDFSISGNEIYSSIHIIDDQFYFTSQIGKWPFYKGYTLNQFSSAGNYIDSSTYNIYLFASPISINQPNAMLFAENKDLGFTQVDFNHRFKIIKRGTIDSTILTTPWIAGIHLYATPRSSFLLEDGNGNVTIDCENKGFITVSGFDNKSYYLPKKIVVSYYELPDSLETENSKNTFGGYLGNLGNGYFHTPPCLPTEVEQIEKPRLLVFPNPTNSEVYVLSEKGNIQLKLINLEGRVIKTNSSQKINVQELPSGLYLLEIWQENQIVETHKIMVQP
jgi:outer membrane protein assembly factor BamB